MQDQPAFTNNIFPPFFIISHFIIICQVPENTKKCYFKAVIKIGIECENIEDAKSRWGVGHLVLNLLKEYAANPEYQKKFQLYLYFKNSVPQDEFLKNPVFVKKIVKLPGINSFNIFYHILMPIGAMRDKIDAMFFPSYMLPPLYFGKSIVMLTNDVYYEYKRGTLPFKYKLAYRLFSNWAALKATKILTISQAAKKELIKFYKISADKIFVAHLGVTPKISNQQPAKPTPWSAPRPIRVGINNDFILYIGQMFPRRRVAESLLAFKKIAGDFPDLKFILVGKDKYNPPIIKNLIRQINSELKEERIICHDYIEEDSAIVSLYKNASLFLYISSSEAFGLPPVEAVSYGVPVVIKDSELNHELFDNAAFFVKNEHSANEIADIIKDGLTNIEKRNYCLQKYKDLIPKLTWRNFAENFFKECEKF